MATVEQEISDLGVAIIWVIEEVRFGTPGLYEHCAEYTESITGAQTGWCVGDGETEPTPGVFDDSPFSEARGFDILVDRSTMEVVLTTNHGTTGGNDNIDGPELLAQIEGIIRSNSR